MTQRALIIDDDNEIQTLGQLLLGRCGYTVTTASGLGELARQPALLDTDLILLDFDLGEFTGLHVIEYLDDLRLDAAILLVSGCGETTANEVVRFGRTSGLRMLGFLPKAALATRLVPLLRHLSWHKPPTADDLAAAMRQEHLFLAYQPQRELPSGRIIGVEALVRWRDPQQGLVSPDRFIPLAEQSQQIVELTWHVLERALAQRDRWLACGWSLEMAVNISPLLLKAPDAIAKFDRLIAPHAENLHGVTLELTESSGIDCFGYARHVLAALRERGCRLSLDDFGTGYSSMTQLYRLPFDELKLDRSFVSRCDHDRGARAITLATVDLGRRLGLEVVAEGIETWPQHDLLRDAGCHRGQGYLFARPMAAMEFDRWYRQQAALPLLTA
ncbi:EAL domain-containing response regulator [Halomonas shantousis]